MKKNNGRSSAFVSASQGEQGFWPSYADMMSAVALILFFLMLLSYIQNLITGNNLQNTQEVLEDTRTQLVFTQTQVEDAQKELALITADLDGAKLELAAQQQAIDDQKQVIAGQAATIDDQKAQAALQAQYLASTQAEIKELRGQMQTIAVLRLSILEQIKDSIAKVMGDSSKVSIGENGSIILSESILFDFGSSAVKPNSTQVLNQLSNVFTSFLSDSESAKYVDSIVISGHTDNKGSEESNRKLSTDRANSVLTYLLQTNSGQLNAHAKYFCSAGYGATRPVASNLTEAGRASNRRIEISIILKDETVLDIVEEYLAIEMPTSEEPPAVAAPKT